MSIFHCFSHLLSLRSDTHAQENTSSELHMSHISFIFSYVADISNEMCVYKRIRENRFGATYAHTSAVQWTEDTASEDTRKCYKTIFIKLSCSFIYSRGLFALLVVCHAVHIWLPEQNEQHFFIFYLMNEFSTVVCAFGVDIVSRHIITDHSPIGHICVCCSSFHRNLQRKRKRQESK